MKFSFFALIMSIILINSFIIFLSLLKNKNKFITNFNVTNIIVFIFLIVFRALFSFEFKNSININSHIILPKIIDLLRTPIYLNSKLTLSSLFLFIWIMGVCIMCVKTIILYLRFSSKFKCISKFTYYDDVTLLETKKQELFINKNIEIHRSNEINIPMVVGITKIKIYIPNIIIPKDKLENLLLHELNHIKNRDNLKKIIILLLKILFWWNPFIYILDNDIEHILEIQCDIQTVLYMSYEERIKYLEDILFIIRNSKNTNNNISSNNFQVSSLYNNKYNKLKQRFYIVLNNEKQQNKKNCVIICSILIFIFISSYIFTFKPIYYPDENYIFTEGADFIIEDDFVNKRNGYIFKIKNKE